MSVSLKSKPEKVCLHCGQSVPENYSQNSFCCMGCRAVYHLIHNKGLDKFYDLKDQKTLPLLNYGEKTSQKESFSWLNEEMISSGELDLFIEGIQCAACVWLIQKLSEKYGGAEVHVIPDRARLSIKFDQKYFQLRDYLNAIEKLGYGLSNFSQSDLSISKSLLIRLGLTWAIAINVMFFSISLYLGVEGSLARVFYHLNFVLGLCSILIGGSYFFKKAFLGLKYKIFHFDFPVSLGILAAGTGSVYSYISNQHAHSYFDSLSIFIALMLTGRYLQEKLLIRNANRSLKSESSLDYRIYCLDQGKQIYYSQIKSNERLLIKSGEFIPVQSELIYPEKIEINISSISGEAEPKIIYKGENIPAGAILLSSQAIEIKALEGFSDSLMFKLNQKLDFEKSLPNFWQRFSKYYVLAIISFSLSAFMVWAFIDLVKASQVLISLLVVTCPCAIGIAMPLAYNMANQSLVSRGVFIKSLDIFEKLNKIKNIFFDKTGTLTLSDLSIINPKDIDDLSSEDKYVLFNLSLRSLHPASRSIYQYLSATHSEIESSFNVYELVGEGLSTQFDDHKYFLGKLKSQNHIKTSAYESAFYKDEKLICIIQFEEEVLDEANNSINFLKNNGFETYILSGDHFDKVNRLALELGIDLKNVKSECHPFDKLNLINHMSPQSSFMIGDGLNDTKALEVAYVSACPISSTRSVISDRVDLFYISKTLSWINHLFKVSQKLSRVQKFNLKFIVIYNTVMISLASLGWVTPLLCAIVMPLSSLFIISLTSFQMNRLEKARK